MAGRLTAVDDRIRLESERRRAASGERLDAGLRQLHLDGSEVADHVAELGRAVDRLDEGRLQRLIDDFRLNDFEADVLVACVLAELDLGCGGIYAYLQDDLSRRYRRPACCSACSPRSAATVRRGPRSTTPRLFCAMTSSGSGDPRTDR
jgi:hypothetical protein